MDATFKRKVRNSAGTIHTLLIEGGLIQSAPRGVLPVPQYPRVVTFRIEGGATVEVERTGSFVDPATGERYTTV